jgi:hypothetical protein
MWTCQSRLVLSRFERTSSRHWCKGQLRAEQIIFCVKKHTRNQSQTSVGDDNRPDPNLPFFAKGLSSLRYNTGASAYVSWCFKHATAYVDRFVPGSCFTLDRNPSHQVKRSLMDAASESAAVVKAHVAKECVATYREPSGILRFPYLVPSGPYQQVWDWDASHMGVGLLSYGGAPYLRGSMMNFLDHVRCVLANRACALDGCGVSADGPSDWRSAGMHHPHGLQ